MAAAITSHHTNAVVRSSPSARTTDSSTSRSVELKCLRLGLSKSSAPLEPDRVEGVIGLFLLRDDDGKVEVDALPEEGTTEADIYKGLAFRFSLSASGWLYRAR